MYNARMLQYWLICPTAVADGLPDSHAKLIAALTKTLEQLLNCSLFDLESQN